MSDNPREKPTDEASATPDPPEASDVTGGGDPTDPPEVATLRQERDELYDRLLRKTAEFDNYRRRVERERREQADETVVELLLDLLLVVDDFERALAVEAGEGADAYRKGVELIYVKVQNLLQKRKVTPIEALGADFDPNVHQAVTQQASADHRENEVIEVLRRGYMRGDRLLRAAMVKVATGE